MNNNEKGKDIQETCCYKQGDKCGVTQERLKACCPCEDYQVAPDSFWEKCKEGLTDD